MPAGLGWLADTVAFTFAVVALLAQPLGVVVIALAASSSRGE